MDREEIGLGIALLTTPDGCKAQVERDGRIVKSYHGETAWQKAQRFAWDLYQVRAIKEMTL